MKPGRRLGTVLNILCLLRNEGFPSICLCASLFCVQFKRSKGGRVPPFEGVSRLRILDAFNLFSACVWKVLLNCFNVSLRSHRRTSTGEVSFLLRSHVACVSKPSQNKTKTFLGAVKGAGGRLSQRRTLARFSRFRRPLPYLAATHGSPRACEQDVPMRT